MSTAQAGIPAHRQPAPVRSPVPNIEEWLRARMMALEPIGDIGDVSFSVSSPGGPLTWETATDWDNGVDEAGVRHESITNADTAGAATIEMGYPTTDRGGSALDAYYPMDEDSGSTVNNESTNGTFPNGTNSGMNNGNAGILGTTCWQANGSPQYIDFGNITDYTTACTITFWVYITSRANYGKIISNGHHNESYSINSQLGGDGDISFQFGSTVKWGATPTNQWAHVACVFDGSTIYLYGDGNQQDSGAATAPGTTSNPMRFMYDDKSDEQTQGYLDEVRFYSRGLSSTEVQALYDTANATAYLETATKSFNSGTKPDLQNLSYSLNGGSITVDVIGSPGTGSEETVSQALDGTTSFDLTWSNSHTDFRVKPKLSVSAVTDTSPTVSTLELAAP